MLGKSAGRDSRDCRVMYSLRIEGVMKMFG